MFAPHAGQIHRQGLDLVMTVPADAQTHNGARPLEETAPSNHINWPDDVIQYTVECRYNAVQYSMILYTSLG